MSIRFALIFLFILVVSSSTAQWMDIASDRLDISFDGATGFMAGGGGTILKTTDFGEHWANVPNPFDYSSGEYSWDILYIKVFDGGQTIFACGGAAYVRFAVSRDGGETWSFKGRDDLFRLSSSLRCYFKDALNGWLFNVTINDSRVAYKTVDGGETWTESPELKRAVGMSFPTPTDGWALFYGPNNQQQSIQRSTDGGQTWEYQNTIASNGTLYDNIRAINDTTAWLYEPILKNGFAIRRTTDGGKNWTSDYSVVGGADDVDIVDTETGWVIDYLGKNLKKTTDGGNSWSINYTLDDQYHRFNKIRFVNDNDGFLIGDNGFMAITHDSGESWEVVNFCPASQYNPVTGMYLDDDRSWIVTESKVLYSDDGRTTWNEFSYVDPYRSAFYDDIAFDGNKGILSGYGLYLSNDNGDTWERSSNRIVERVSMYMRDNNTVWFTSGNGVIYKSIDGGLTATTNWTPDFLTPKTLWQLAFSRHDSLVFAYTDNTFVMTSKDAGLTWSPATATEKISYMYFINNFIGWKITIDDSWMTQSLHKTTNGGKTWTKQAGIGPFRPADYRKSRLTFVDENNGWLLSGSSLYKTDDGGRTWNQENIGTKYGLNSFETSVDVDGKLIMYVGGRSVSKFVGNIMVDSVDPNEPPDIEGPITGLEDIKEQIRVYPNPASNRIYISHDVQDAINKMSVLNSLGDEVIVVAPTNDKTQFIDVSNLNSGLYFVVLETAKGKLSYKIIKQ